MTISRRVLTCVAAAATLACLAAATLLMVGSMAAFAIEDLFLKRAAMALPPGQVVAMMGAGGLIFTAIIWLIAFFLLFYARAMAKRGVLG